MLSVAVTYPLDFVRGRLTVQGGIAQARRDQLRRRAATEASLCTESWPKRTRFGPWFAVCNGWQARYAGIGDALRTIVREEGVRGIYRGLSVTLVGIFPYVRCAESRPVL